MEKITILFDPDKIVDFNFYKEDTKKYRKKRWKPLRARKKVLSYSLAGKLLKVYNSAVEASIKERISYNTLTDCASGRKSLACRHNGGRIYLYELESIESRIQKILARTRYYSFAVKKLKKKK